MSAIEEDYKRYYQQSSYPSDFKKWFHTVTNPGFQAVAGFRTCQWLLHKKIPFVGQLIQRLVEVWTGVSIPAETQIGPGLMILHFGGIMINHKAAIGKFCTLHHGVTIGNKNSGGGSPKIGDRVMIGAGAKVLGEITIGNDVEIGANAVVLDSIPDGAIAVGIPAKVIRTKPKTSEAKS